MKTFNCVGLPMPFDPWTCAHGWDPEIEGKPCLACQGICFSCGRKSIPLDEETGNCLWCQDVFDSDYEFYKESIEPYKGSGRGDEIT